MPNKYDAAAGIAAVDVIEKAVGGLVCGIDLCSEKGFPLNQRQVIALHVALADGLSEVRDSIASAIAFDETLMAAGLEARIEQEKDAPQGVTRIEFDRRREQ